MTELFTSVAPDRRGQVIGVTARRVVLALFALVSLAALAGLIGQRPSVSAHATPAVRMTLSAPETVRGGIFFQSRVDVRALRPIQYPRLVLSDGWLEGMQVNSIEPSPASESSRDGRVVLSYGSLQAGDILRVWMQFEVNPTNVGNRSYTLELDDGDHPIARIPRTLRVLP